MLGCTGPLSGFFGLAAALLSVFRAAFSATVLNGAGVKQLGRSAGKVLNAGALPAASAASSAACAAAMAAGSRSAEKSGMSSSSTDGAGATPAGRRAEVLRPPGRAAPRAGHGGCGRAAALPVRTSGPAPGAAVCASASVSKRMTPVGSETSGGVAAASRRCSVRVRGRGVRARQTAPAAGKLGGLTGAGRSKSSIGSKSAVWSASRVGGVRRRSENRTVLPRLRAASDTTSSGRSMAGAERDAGICQLQAEQTAAQQVQDLVADEGIVHIGRQGAGPAPRRSHTSTKGHCPTLAGM